MLDATGGVYTTVQLFKVPRVDPRLRGHRTWCTRTSERDHTLFGIVSCSRIASISLNHAVLFAAFTFAHRALCAAAIFLRATAESVRFPRIGTTLAASRTFAQRALWAAAILARADLDSFRVPVPLLYVLPKAASAAPIPRSSLVNRSCSFFSRRTTPAKLDIRFPLGAGLYQGLGGSRPGELVVGCVQSAELAERGMLRPENPATTKDH